MPLDAICMQAVVRETAAQIENTRIEKIQQPARDQVILLLRGGRRLLLNAGASQPRLHLTWQLRDNPAQPPMFCMLLRKHLAGGRLLRPGTGAAGACGDTDHPGGGRAGGAERLPPDPGGHAPPRQPHSGGSGGPHRGLPAPGGLRDVPAASGAAGALLPPAAPSGQVRPADGTEEDAFRRLLARRPEDSPLDRWLMDTFTAIPPLLARELVCRTCGETDARSTDPDTLWQTFHTWQQQVQEGALSPAAAGA